jgi:hypothetical protein
LLAGPLAYGALLPAAKAQGEKSPKTATAAPTAPPPSTTAAAAPNKEVAAALADGQRAFEAADYPIAVQYFSKAHALEPSAQTAYWLAMAQDKSGQPAEAHQSFAAFFADPNHAALGEDKVAQARARFEELAAMPAKVNVTVAPPQAQLSVDGQLQSGSTPFTLELPAGKHQIQVTAPGYVTEQREIEAQPAAHINHGFELAAEPPPAPPPAAPAPEPAAPTEAKSSNKVPAYVTLGVAGAAAVAGTIFGIQALSAKSDFDKNPTDSHADDVERNGLIADMAFGIAITLGVTGIVLLTSDEPEETATASARVLPKRKAPRLVVTPYATPKSGGAAARMTF